MYWVERVNKDWLDRWGELASESVFGAMRAKDLDRAQFAIVSYKEQKPTGYVTCIEMDSETLYWQIGGAFEKGVYSIVPSYAHMIEWSLKQYKRITTRIENENINMLHLAMKMGFRIVGTWNFEGKIFLELILEGNKWQT